MKSFQDEGDMDAIAGFSADAVRSQAMATAALLLFRL